MPEAKTQSKDKTDLSSSGLNIVERGTLQNVAGAMRAEEEVRAEEEKGDAAMPRRSEERHGRCHGKV